MALARYSRRRPRRNPAIVSEYGSERLMHAINEHRRQGDYHYNLADEIESAWQQHDYEWLIDAGYLNRREVEYWEDSDYAG